MSRRIAKAMLSHGKHVSNFKMAAAAVVKLNQVTF